jgi:hypothetical protein
MLKCPKDGLHFNLLEFRRHERAAHRNETPNKPVLPSTIPTVETPERLQATEPSVQSQPTIRKVQFKDLASQQANQEPQKQLT